MRLTRRKHRAELFGFDLRALLIRLAINTVAILLAAKLIRGIHVNGWQAAVLAGAIFGLVNTFIRSALRPVSLPLKLLTLGLFTFIVNVAALAATSWIAEQTKDVHFRVDGFGAAVVGALVISLVSWLAALAFGDK